MSCLINLHKCQFIIMFILSTWRVLSGKSPISISSLLELRSISPIEAVSPILSSLPIANKVQSSRIDQNSNSIFQKILNLWCKIVHPIVFKMLINWWIAGRPWTGLLLHTQCSDHISSVQKFSEIIEIVAKRGVGAGFFYVVDVESWGIASDFINDLVAVVECIGTTLSD